MSIKDQKESLKQQFQEVYQMGPIEKYQKKNIFPFQFVAQILMILLIIIVITDDNAEGHSKQFRDVKLWNNFFMQSDSSIEIQDIPQFQSHFNNMLNNINNIDNLLIQNVDISKTKFEIEVIKLNLEYFNFNKTDEYHFQFNFQFHPKNGIEKPFNLTNIESIQKFVQRTQAFQIKISSLKLVNRVWNINLNYNMVDLGRIITTLQTQYYDQDLDENYLTSYYEILLKSIIMALGIFCLYLDYHQVIRIINMYLDYQQFKQNTVPKGSDNRLNDYLNERSYYKKKKNKNILTHDDAFFLSQEQLQQKKKFKFVDNWLILSFISNISVISSYFCSILSEYRIYGQNEYIVNKFVAFSNWLMCIHMMKYFIYQKNLTLMTSILQKSLNEIVQFMIGFFVFFIAYSLCAWSLFYQYPSFNSLQSSVNSLLSMLAGDSINAQFIIMAEHGWIGRWFIISFLIIFVIAVHNIFISIITKFYAKKSTNYQDTKLALKMVKKQQELIQEQKNIMNVPSEISDNLQSTDSKIGLKQSEQGFSILKLQQSLKLKADVSIDRNDQVQKFYKMIVDETKEINLILDNIFLETNIAISQQFLNKTQKTNLNIFRNNQIISIEFSIKVLIRNLKQLQNQLQ